MINFSWSVLSANEFEIRVRTPVTRVGTLHRLAAAIYVLGFDVELGDVDTVVRDGEALSDDRFILRSPPGENLAISSSRLGVLMEALLRGEQSPDALFKENNVEPPDFRLFFDSKPDILFEEQGNMTQFYFESVDRRGLLLHLTRVLSKLGINVVKASIRTSDQGHARDTFFLQYNDKPLGAALAGDLELAVQGLHPTGE